MLVSIIHVFFVVLIDCDLFQKKITMTEMRNEDAMDADR